MNRNSNTYTFIYSAILVIVVAAVLALVAEGLRERQTDNVSTEKRLYILRAAGLEGKAYDLSGTERNAYTAEAFEKYVTAQYVIDAAGERITGLEAFEIDMKAQADYLAKGRTDEVRLPVYECTTDAGEKRYVVGVYGTGLWGAIWGYLALQPDMNTIAGAVFDHKSETPGLGGEIATDEFSSRFVGKTLFEGNDFQSIIVEKGGRAAEKPHAVDAISGGTMTSRGVENMIRTCLSGYLPFLRSLQVN